MVRRLLEPLRKDRDTVAWWAKFQTTSAFPHIQVQFQVQNMQINEDIFWKKRERGEIRAWIRAREGWEGIT